MKRIIFVTGLTLWSMGKDCGGPAFTQTVNKYLQENWDVYIISDVYENIDYDKIPNSHNITVKKSPFKNWTQKRKIGLLFRYLDHFIANRKFEKEIRKRIVPGETILYAYEIFGVKACEKVSRKTNIPLVTRFQGTVLSQYKDTITNRIRRFPHFQALSTKADLVIMTDDGTDGLNILNNLNKDNNILFLRNGLELMEKNITEFKKNFNRNAFRKQFNVGEDDFLFLTVSRLVEWKHVERAIKAFSNVHKEKRKTKMIVVGDGEEKNNLQEMALELGVKDCVYFVGAVEHREVYKYMISCDAFLSLYDLSNVGNPLLEAMTLGTCIVTLDVGDTRKLIYNDINGILITYDEIDKLGDILSDLIDCKAKRDLLKKNAEKYAHDNFMTWEQRMEIEYEKVNELLKKGMK